MIQSTPPNISPHWSSTTKLVIALTFTAMLVALEIAAGSFLAMAYALRRGDHIRVTLILSRLKGRTRYWMEVLCLVVATLLSAYFAWFAAKLVWGSYVYHDVSQNVDATPLWIPQLSMAIGLFGLAVAFAEQLVLTLGTGKLAPGTDEAAHVE